MTTCLYNLLTAGGDRMAQLDPHGWTLTIVAVSVVFIALVILYFVYNLSGEIFSGKFKRKPKMHKGEPDGEVAVAIAMALEAETGDGATQAAIAVALHLYLSDAIHDVETGIITIRKPASAWDDKQRNFRKTPRR